MEILTQLQPVDSSYFETGYFLITSLIAVIASFLAGIWS